MTLVQHNKHIEAPKNEYFYGRSIFIVSFTSVRIYKMSFLNQQRIVCLSYTLIFKLLHKFIL